MNYTFDLMITAAVFLGLGIVMGVTMGDLNQPQEAYCVDSQAIYDDGYYDGYSDGIDDGTNYENAVQYSKNLVESNPFQD